VYLDDICIPTGNASTFQLNAIPESTFSRISPTNRVAGDMIGWSRGESSRHHVEQEQFRVLRGADSDRRRLGPCGAIAGAQDIAIRLDSSACDL
jgi:hypothetical protein